jgi:hypothetical protein
MRTRLSLLLTAGLLAGCQLTLISFSVPTTVALGQVFDVVVQLQGSSQNGFGGCVLQVPNGFAVLGTSAPGSVVHDDPTLLALYTPEPGHFLASFSRNDGSSFGVSRYYAYVQAPATVTAATLKIALAGQPTGQAWQANSPVGVTQFAQITAATHAQPINVVTVPPQAFHADAIGLPYGTMWTSLWGTALHDLDGDGNDDLLANTRAFLRGAGNWTEASNGLVNPTPLTSMRVAAGDFDGDGFADIAHGRGTIFFGNGGSSWTPGPALPLATQTYGVAVGDVNGDGRDDVAFGGYFINHLRVFFGNVNRTFTDASNGLPALGNLGGQEVQLRDVTGDGHLDVVWHQVWAGDSQGNWTPSTGLVGSIAQGVDSGDLDGDGLPELVHANGSAGVTVHRHLGGNAWAVAATYALPGREAESVVVLDYDRDGRNDLVIGYRDGINGIELRRNLGGGTFATVAGSGLPASTATYVNDLAVGDINGDSFPDLAAVFFGQGTMVYQNWLPGLSSYGTACASTLVQAPEVAGTSAPLLGSPTFGVRVAGGQPGTLALLWLGTSRHTWSGVPALPLPLDPFGAVGCTLWTGPEVSSGGLFDPAGTFTLPVPIPANPVLARATVFAQGAAFAPGSLGLGLAFTAGLAIRVD